jgi:hypothetical protein
VQIFWFTLLESNMRISLSRFWSVRRMAQPTARCASFDASDAAASQVMQRAKVEI